MNDRLGSLDGAVHCPPGDIIVASLLYLLSRYAFEKDARLIHCITRHLSILKSHPDMQSQILQSTVERLMAQWELLVETSSNKQTNLH